MRIVVVGGFSKSLLNFRGHMLRAMVANGHQVLGVAPQGDPDVGAELRDIGVDYATVPLARAGLNPFRDLRTVIALVRRYRAFRADAVFVYSPKPIVYGSIAARLANTRLRAVMVTGVGSALGGGPGWRRTTLASVVRLLYRVALRQVHVVFFQNPDDERLFRLNRLVGDGQRIVRVRGSGIDLDWFRPMALPPPPITFLMIARLVRDKGVTEYAQAARLVHRTHPEARFQLLGGLDPNPTGISAADLAAMKQEGEIEYLGTVTDVRPVIGGAHVIVLPSYGEGMPRSVLEGMAMARPILTTDAPGCRETVEQDRNGFLVPVRNAQALADGMVRMLAEPAQLAPMGRESRAIAEARFDVHSVNAVILESMGLQGSSAS